MKAPIYSIYRHPRLTEFHRRCLDRRVSECQEILARAVGAFTEAEAWEPRDALLPVACDLLQAAQKLTELAAQVQVDNVANVPSPQRRVL